jgi:subtilisin family serine protease
VTALRHTADTAQAGVRATLKAARVKFRPHHISNTILVRGGDSALVHELAAAPEVARLLPTRTYKLDKTVEAAPDAGVQAVEWGITAIHAHTVWDTYGARGEGIVVANIDTGVEYDHPALVNRYRGTTGAGTYDHNYNWYDPSQVCPGAAPCDNVGHGTHTMGTMVGADASGNQVGVAPGARWIAAKGCEETGARTRRCSARRSGSWRRPT